MQTSDYIKKYDFESGRFNTDSLLVDMAIDFITKIELQDKFETPYKAFKLECDKINNKYINFKKYAPSLNGVHWNLFYAKTYSRLRNLFYQAEPLSNGTPDYKNAYENTPDDCDFFLWVMDESEELKESKYTIDYSCFLKIYPQVTDDEKVILEEYENMIGDETSEDDRYEYTLAKNQCLYLLNRGDFDLEKAREILHGKHVTELKSKQPEPIPEPKAEPKREATLPAQREPEQVEANEEDDNIPANQEKMHVVTYTPDPQSSAIKAMLFDNLKAIQQGKMDVNRANSFNSTVQTYINMSKAQLEIEKFVQSKQRKK